VECRCSERDQHDILCQKAMIEVGAEKASDAIRNQNADIMYLFPVNEEKWKEGVLVHKVRLVADGRTHHHAGDTYSATPSREELFILSLRFTGIMLTLMKSELSRRLLTRVRI